VAEFCRSHLLISMGKGGMFLAAIPAILIIFLFILGIVLLVKTSKYFKSLENKE